MNIHLSLKSFFYRLLVLLFCVSGGIANAEEVLLAEPQISQIQNDELATGINKVFQDHSGFIWFGTNQGLLRFDGYQTIRFVASQDESGLSDNAVWDMAEDSAGYLWISTYGGGLNRYDPHTQTFKHFKRQKAAQSISSDALWAIEKKDDSSLWIGSRNWLNLFDTVAMKNQRLSPDSTPALPIDNNVWALRQDSRKRLWIGTLGQGLYRYDPQSGSLVQFKHKASDEGSLSNDLVRSIVEDRQGNIWIGTDNGLNRLTPDSGKITRFMHDDSPQSLSSNEINRLFIDSSQRLWVGTYGSGLNLFNRQTEDFSRYDFDSLGLDDSRKPKIINDIYQDRQGILWFATEKGPFKINPEAMVIHRLKVPKDESAQVLATHQSADGKSLWVAYDNRLAKLSIPGLTPLNTVRLEVTATDIAESPSGDIWLGTERSGLLRFDATGSLKAQYRADKTPLSLPSNGIASLKIDSDNRLWLGLYRTEQSAGLVLYDPEKGVQKRWFEDKNIVDIESLDNTTLLLATNQAGVIVFNSKSHEHEFITNPQQFNLNNINDLLVERSGNIWIATHGAGLARLSLKRKTIESVSSAITAVSWLWHDNDGSLWLAADNALYHYLGDTRPLQKFDEKDGFATTGSSTKAVTTADGKLVFGASNGLSYLSTKDLDSQPTDAQMVLTGLKLFNQPVALSRPDAPTPLTRALPFSDKVTLTYRDYLFSLTFSALDFRHPNRIGYRYRLDGFDDRWFETGPDDRIATFSNIPPGHYRLIVEALEGNGKPLAGSAAMNLEILPPWWKTLYAYAAMAILAGLLLYLVIHLRTATLKRQAHALELGIKARTTELEHKTQTIESLLSQKRRMFSNLSHEFRTPLTLILGPLKQLLSKERPSEEKQQLDTAVRNGKRLLQMVDQLLLLAKLDAPAKQAMQHYALEPMLRTLVAAFEPLAKEKAQQLVFGGQTQAVVRLLPDSFEVIIGNLLSNAIKYTPEGGSIRVTLAEHQQRLKITIEDNGIGIEPAHQQSVFERFDRGEFDGNEQVPGAGIGLALVKELLDANAAEISLTSTPKHGCRFDISIPIVTHRDNDVHTVPTINPSTSTEIYALQQHDRLNTEKADDDKPSLLIVEDNPDMQAHLYQLLSCEYHCLQAANGDDGLSLAKTQVPDIILCDIMMPVMDGFAFSRAIKQDEALSHIPIMLLTAKADEDSRKQGWQQHVDDYLTKPFDAEELHLRLENLLVIRHILRKRYAGELRHNPAKLLSVKNQLSAKDQGFIDKFEKLLERHYPDSEFQLGDAAASLAMSDRQLQRKLKALMDMTFSDYLRSLRLRKAVEWLAQGMTSAELIDRVGFSSPSYFANCFKAEFNQTPKQFQLELQQKQQKSREIDAI